MSDREFGGNDDLSLPKATVQKIITEILATNDSESSISFARDARDLLIDCCVEFITLISSEANEIAEREAKKTIATEHIDKALKELGFPEYVGEVLASAGEMKESLKTREKKTSKMDQSGLTQEELLQQQQELFASATSKFNQGP
ncbi:histone-fold-containing protein [Usnea florida]